MHEFKGSIDNSKVHPVLKAYFGYCLHKAATQLREKLCSNIVQFGLSPLHLGILRLLTTGNISQIDLGDQLGIDKATMVKLIDILEDKKLVKRNPSKVDRRIKFIEITPSGKKMIEKVSKIRQKVENEFLSKLSINERKVLLEAIPKLLDLS